MRVDVSAMRAMIAADRAAGLHPICVIGTAGTVNSGATDDLDALADLAAAEKLWFHVDGAFGALARLSPAAGPDREGDGAGRLAGARPAQVGLPAVRDRLRAGARPAGAPRRVCADAELPARRGARRHRRRPRVRRPRPRTDARLQGAEGVDVVQGAGHSMRSPRSSSRTWRRRARLPTRWRGCRTSRSARRCRSTSSAGATCPTGFSDAQCDALNRELLLRIQESGLAVPSGSLVNGRYAIRVCITNHRTRWADLEALADGVVPLARAIEAEMRS